MAAKEDLREAVHELLTVTLGPNRPTQSPEAIERAASALTDHIDALVEEHVRAHAEEAPHLYADGSGG